MCAAHSGDLEAAASLGLRTCFIARPNEHPSSSERPPVVPAPLLASSVEDLADQLGA
jgi:2-haloacid dehalogenase